MGTPTSLQASAPTSISITPIQGLKPDKLGRWDVCVYGSDLDGTETRVSFAFLEHCFSQYSDHDRSEVIEHLLNKHKIGLLTAENDKIISLAVHPMRAFRIKNSTSDLTSTEIGPVTLVTITPPVIYRYDVNVKIKPFSIEEIDETHQRYYTYLKKISPIAYAIKYFPSDVDTDRKMTDRKMIDKSSADWWKVKSIPRVESSSKVKK